MARWTTIEAGARLIGVAVLGACATGPGAGPSGTATELATRPVWVIGEVARPGSVEAAGGLTVTEALARAGGLTADARGDRVLVRSGGANAPGEAASPDHRLASGDVVEVPARLF